jgi:hypothetical protein
MYDHTSGHFHMENHHVYQQEKSINGQFFIAKRESTKGSPSYLSVLSGRDSSPGHQCQVSILADTKESIGPTAVVGTTAA